MRLPIRDITGHIVWTVDGRAYAIYRVEMPGPARPTRRVAHKLLNAQTAVLKQLRGDVVLTSLCPQRDPVSVARSMVEGINLDERPAWAETVENTLDMLQDVEMIDRTHWLSIPLSDGGSRAMTNELAAAASTFTHTVASTLGVAPPRIAASTLARMTQLAASYISKLHGLTLTPATEAQIVWWIARAARRGLAEPPLPAPDENAAVSTSRAGTCAALSDVILDEGGRTDEHKMKLKDQVRRARRKSETQNLFARRYVKVISEHGASYQSFLTQSELPAAWSFPGSEWFTRLDDYGFGVDWQARITIIPNQIARDKTRKQSRELMHQHSEWDIEEGQEPPPDLARATNEVADQADRLSASSTEVELLVSTVLCVWGESAQQVIERADIVASVFTSNEHQVQRPLGNQDDLYRCMLPGAPTPQVMHDYRQHLLAVDFAMSAPFLTSSLGDPNGALFGLTLDGGLCRPVMFDVTRGCRTNTSSSFAVLGELGAGKSVILKSVAFDVLTRVGGRVVGIDRTASQEYAQFARACPGTVEVVALTADATVSIDPLRVFGPDRRRHRALSFFNTLLDLPTTELPGIVMDAAVSAVAHSAAPHSRAVITELERLAEGTGARAEQAYVLAERLRHIADAPMGQLIFDPALRVVDIGATDALFFSTHDVPLPTAEELRDSRSAARIDPSRLLGRALHVTIAGIARDVAFADSRFVLVLFDECYSITDSPDGLALYAELVRDGRKHDSAVGMGGHVVVNLGPPKIRNLITTRLLGRHTDPDLAADALEWLGDGQRDDPEMLELVRTGLSPVGDDPAANERRAGEFLMSHRARQTGTLKVLIPPYRNIPNALLTTPGDAAA